MVLVTRVRLPPSTLFFWGRLEQKIDSLGQLTSMSAHSTAENKCFSCVATTIGELIITAVLVMVAVAVSAARDIAGIVAATFIGLMWLFLTIWWLFAFLIPCVRVSLTCR